MPGFGGRGRNPADFSYRRPACADRDKRAKGIGSCDNGSIGKEFGDACSVGVSDALAIDDDKEIEKFRQVNAFANTIGGDMAAWALQELPSRTRSLGAAELHHYHCL